MLLGSLESSSCPKRINSYNNLFRVSGYIEMLRKRPVSACGPHIDEETQFTKSKSENGVSFLRNRQKVEEYLKLKCVYYYTSDNLSRSDVKLVKSL